jgi:hypothetical protein
MNDSATDEQVLILETRGKETQLYNATTICLGLDDRQKHTHTVGGAAAPSALTPPSAESDPASDGDTGEGSPPRRKMSAPHLGHRCLGLLQEPGPSRRLDRPLRSLSQLSPEDLAQLMASAAQLQGRSRQWTTRPGSGRRCYASSAWEVPCSWADEAPFSSQLRLCPC